MRQFFSAIAVALFLPGSAADLSAQEGNYGRAIQLTESELFVGQPVNWYGPGVVYTYALDPSGQYTESSRLTASDPSTKDDFGRALAVDGNTLMVAAPRKRDGSGVVYVFGRTGQAAGWRQHSIIEPPGRGDHTEYGVSLVLDGEDDLLVGAPAVDSTGVVYHYAREGGAWRLGVPLRSVDLTGPAALGRALALSGDWLAVGAPMADSAAGRVVLFHKDDRGAWKEAGVVSPPAARARPGAGFGSSLAWVGDRVYAGVPGQGVVLALARGSDGAWHVTDELRPPAAGQRTQFGRQVARVDDELWVGAPGANRSNGTVYRYRPDPDGGWRPPLRLDAQGAPEATSWPFAFGATIAAAGPRAVVGMPSRDFGEGRVLTVHNDGTDWRPGQTLEGEIFRLGADLEPGARCDGGKIGDFPCSNMQLVSHMSISELGGDRGVWVNDVWGWTDPQTQKNYALVARRDGTSFVDLTDVSRPRLVGTLDRTPGSPPTVWRDVKVLNNHAYIVSDAAGEHGMQVFDLTRLRDLGEVPVEFAPDTTYHEIHSAHNVVADTASGFLYVVGANGGGQTCGGGLHMVDAREPLHPTFAGCYNDRSGANERGYTHDAQCLVYAGPDADYQGRQICVGSNEKEINIADVTDKEDPKTVGRGSYPNAAYTHQGWFDDEQRYFYQNDELDEVAGSVAGTRTIVWDLTELDDPIVVREYIGPVNSSDHNLFVSGDRVYESNYGSGLRVLDISQRDNPREIAFFDSAPNNQDGPGHSSSQSGAWSNYPFFGDGIIVFTSVREGLFIVRVAESKPAT